MVHVSIVFTDCGLMMVLELGIVTNMRLLDHHDVIGLVNSESFIQNCSLELNESDFQSDQ